MLGGRGGKSVALLVAAAALVGGSDTGSAATVCPQTGFPCAGPVELTPSDVRIFPRKLPARSPAPIAFRGGARISAGDGSHPPALREATLRVDRGVAVDARDLPVCEGGGRDVLRGGEEVREECREAILGRGAARIQLAFPETVPIWVRSEFVLINGGIKDGATTLYAHAVVPIPQPREVVATIRMRRHLEGRFGWLVEVEIPVTAGGYGSLLAFDLNVWRKTLLSARCPRGELRIEMSKAVFRNEAGVPGQAAQTVLKGGLLVPCTPPR